MLLPLQHVLQEKQTVSHGSPCLSSLTAAEETGDLQGLRKAGPRQPRTLDPWTLSFVFYHKAELVVVGTERRVRDRETEVGVTDGPEWRDRAEEEEEGGIEGREKGSSDTFELI